MPNLGPLEILAILVVALLVFGPNKLPEMGRQIGRAMREVRKFQGTLQDGLRDAFEEDKTASRGTSGSSTTPGSSSAQGMPNTPDSPGISSSEGSSAPSSSGPATPDQEPGSIGGNGVNGNGAGHHEASGPSRPEPPSSGPDADPS